ncbi:MAG: TauD/TfdA family dioxygenase [Pseudomonadota bacterium]
MAIEILPTDSVIGAEVRGVSLADVPAPETQAAIEEALERHGVLIFRNQQITPAQQVAFSGALADLAPTMRVAAQLPGHPEIFVIGNTGEKIVSFAPTDGSGELEWHSDHMHLEHPARASMMYCLETPPSGGETVFACMYTAFDALNPAEQAEAEGLTACHSVSGLNNFLRTKGEAETAAGAYNVPDELVVRWPLVRRHPLTGRKALYFGTRVTIGIEGWEDARAHAYIAELNSRATVPDHRYSHAWMPGDAVLWDNRRTLHAGTPFDTSRYRREMHRTTLLEDSPIV